MQLEDKNVLYIDCQVLILENVLMEDTNTLYPPYSLPYRNCGLLCVEFKLKN